MFPFFSPPAMPTFMLPLTLCVLRPAGCPRRSMRQLRKLDTRHSGNSRMHSTDYCSITSGAAELSDKISQQFQWSWHKWRPVSICLTFLAASDGHSLRKSNRWSFGEHCGIESQKTHSTIRVAGFWSDAVWGSVARQSVRFGLVVFRGGFCSHECGQTGGR